MHDLQLAACIELASNFSGMVWLALQGRGYAVELPGQARRGVLVLEGVGGCSCWGFPMWSTTWAPASAPAAE